MAKAKPKQERKCPVCGRSHIRPAYSKVRHCSHECGAIATRVARVDRAARVQEVGKALKAYIRRKGGAVPDATTFAQHFTKGKKSSALAMICQYVDPRQTVYGSYSATLDAIYAEAGHPRNQPTP